MFNFSCVYETRLELFFTRFHALGAIAGFVVPVCDLWKCVGFFLAALQDLHHFSVRSR